jgi:ParB family transcriptional regulator, chromosome partitioning protein
MTDPVPQDKTQRLGRGLGALITPVKAPIGAAPGERLRDIHLTSIVPNRHQPRRRFRTDELAELENSLRTNGLLQPITVRVAGDAYEIIAGERRVRAARALGWTSIPAIVRESSDSQSLTLALVENLQRQDLNPIEEAEGYSRLMHEFGLTQLEVGEAVGRDRSTVANLLRLLNLPDEVQQFVRDSLLTEGHARALLALPDAGSVLDVARQAIKRKLTVRDVERLAQEGRARPRRQRDQSSHLGTGAPEVRGMSDRLRRYLQTDVEIVTKDNTQGELRIRFYSPDDLERLLGLITGKMEHGP